MKTCWRVMIGMAAVLSVVCGMVARAAEAPAAAAAPAKETPKQEAKAAVAAEAPAVLPPGQATLGVHFLDQDVETFGDVLLPVYQLGNGLLFVNPRGTINDSDGQEGNIGAGYRLLFPDKNFIVGANVYYDVRDTELDNTFDQVGVGLEFLSQWVDARINYYLPEDDIKEGDIHLQRTDAVREVTQHWRKPRGDSNIIEQYGWTADSTYEVTSLQHFRIYEEALEGFDAEIGALLPIPVVQDYADVKVFMGWYDFESDLGGGLEGVKARMEVRALPSLYLDGAWYEDEELYGSRYSVGARASVPFDLAKLSKGRNPFAGALAGFKPSREKAPFASRLTDMVIRDLHVRTGASEAEEIVEDRRILDKKLVSRTKKGKYQVLETDVIFVDDDNRSGNEDGSWEHPYRLIQTGVDDPRGRMVYVLDAREQYYENVIMREGMVLWGNGCPYYGSGGQFLGNGVFPVVNGQPYLPVFTLASGVELAGFEIYRPGGVAAGGASAEDKFPSMQVAAAIYGYNVTDLNIHCNYIHGDAMLDYTQTDKGIPGGSGIQITCNDMDSFSAAIWNNRVENFYGNGIGLNLSGVSGVDVLLADNRVVGNTEHGMELVAYGTEGEAGDDVEGVPPGVFLARISGEYSENGNDGVWLSVHNYDTAAALFVDTVADRNWDTGISVDMQANFMAGALFASHAELDRLDQLVNTVMGGINLFPTISEDGEPLSVADMLGIGELYREDSRMQANGNRNGGIFLGMGADVNLAAFLGVKANGNGYYHWVDEAEKQGGWGGFNINLYSVDEEAEPVEDGPGVSLLAMIRCEANDNAPGPGINAYATADEMALGIFMDVSANRNYGCGLRGGFTSPDGMAGALVMSSDPLFGLIENLTANPLLGDFVTPMDMDFITPYGQVQMNDNGGSGINIEVNGEELALALVLDAQANGNGNYYDATEKPSTVQAGIQLDISSEDGTAIGIVASTETLMGMLQEVLDHEEIPMDLGDVSSLGPVQANGNAGVGVHVYATGEDSIVGVLGVEALDNGWGIHDVEKNGYAGDGIDIVANATWGDAMVGLADVNASRNNGVGIHVDANANSEFGEAMIGGILITANENQYDGLQLSASSLAPASSYLVLADVEANDSVYGSGIYGQVNGRGDTAAALQDIEASGNAGKGIWLDVNSHDGDAHVWVGEGAVAAMNDHMGDWDWDLFDEIVPMLPDGGVETAGNGLAGVRIEAESQSGDVLVGVAGLTSTGNGGDMEDDDHAGLAILVDAYGTDDDGNAEISVFDSLLTGNTGNGLRIRASADNSLWVEVDGVTATGNDNSGVKAVLDAWIVEPNFTHNVMSGNGRDGLRLNLDADYGVQLFGEYNVMRDNGDDGLDVSTSAPNRYYDFGGGIYSSAGMNSMSGNGGYDVERNGKGPFYIMNSYWGGTEPVYGVDYVGNNMQVGGWLATDPNP